MCYFMKELFLKQIPTIIKYRKRTLNLQCLQRFEALPLDEESCSCCGHYGSGGNSRIQLVLEVTTG